MNKIIKDTIWNAYKYGGAQVSVVAPTIEVALEMAKKKIKQVDHLSRCQEVYRYE